MSNVSSVQAVYQAFGQGDIPTILDLMADDVAWEAWADNHAQAVGVPNLLPRRGKAGVAEFFAEVATYEFTDFQVLSFMDGGHQVAVEVALAAKLPNGNVVADEEIHLWTFDDTGKVTRMRHYTDTAKHIAAARPS